MQTSDLDTLIVVGDRILVKPLKQEEKTDTGLFLPPGVREKEKVQQGYVVKLGPGYIIPSATDGDESWKTDAQSSVKYIPLQAQIGDLAIFLMSNATEVIYKKERYYIIPQHAVLLLDRQDL